MTQPKMEFRTETASRLRPGHERPHNKKEGRNDKRGDEQVSHGREKVPYLKPTCNLNP